MAVFTNGCLYQLGWFACVLGAGMDRPGLGMTCALALIVVHLWLSGGTLRQLTLMATAGVIGLTIDTLQLWWGVFHFPHGMIVHWLANKSSGSLPAPCCGQPESKHPPWRSKSRC